MQVNKFLILILACAWCSLVSLTNEQLGGVYYAYPTPAPYSIDLPKGYEPFYISHYGRHGSRWLTSDGRYQGILDYLDKQELTPEGEKLREMAGVAWEQAKGHGGELTQLGAVQHNGIAHRLIKRYPEIFVDSALIEAKSSTSGRCVMSMAAFTEGLKEVNPSLKVIRENAARDMSFINNEPPRLKQFRADTSAWHSHYKEYRDLSVPAKRFSENIFMNPDEVENLTWFMEELFWLSESMQNVGLDLDFFQFFNQEELEALRHVIDYRQYVVNFQNSPAALGPGPESAKPLLQRFVDDANKALGAGFPAANLRFGHDTSLMQLLSLMDIGLISDTLTSPNSISKEWKEHEFIPMAANLQLIFFRNPANPDAPILVQILLNEKPLGGLTPWDSLSEHFISRIALQ